MFPNIDPKKMQAVMKQMGIAQTEVPASRVIIEKIGGGRVIIKNPSVAWISMQGNESFQISGQVDEEGGENEENDFSEADVKKIMEKTGCSELDAINALEETGDLADAILKLSK